MEKPGKPWGKQTQIPEKNLKEKPLKKSSRHAAKLNPKWVAIMS